MLFQVMVRLILLPTERTLMKSTVTVYPMLMELQSANQAKTFVTQRTLVRLFSGVDAHVTISLSRLQKHLITHLTFKRFLSTVNSVVLNQVTRRYKSFLANSTFKRFLS